MKKYIYLVLTSFISLVFIFGCNSTKENVDFVNFDASVSTSNVDKEEAINQEDQTSKENAQVEDTSSAEAPKEDTDAKTECPLEDGVYVAEFDTDSSMFHVNEMCDGKGELTVKDGIMTIHVSLTSKNIVNLYYGLAEDAQAEGAVLLEPTIDTIDYDDGTTEEVNGFDIPVPYLDDEFDVALIGTKGKWYDHKVSVSNPVFKDEADSDENNSQTETAITLEEGEYTIDVDLEGGSGKATITSPAIVKKSADSTLLVVEWSSPNYDYMIVNEEKYLPVNTEGNSVFEIPVESFDEPLEVTADTVAMSKPHEIEYKLIFHSDTVNTSE